MEIIETALYGAAIIVPRVFCDGRGWFYESYSKRELERLGISAEFVQDNRSFSAVKGTLRGLHCQTGEAAQAKLISCARGALRDVIVDIRRGSPSYMKWIAVELTDENKYALFVPRGFLHGFVTLTDDVEVSYKADNFYSPAHEAGVRFDDPDIGAGWGVSDPILSQKDADAPFLRNSNIIFTF